MWHVSFLESEVVRAEKKLMVVVIGPKGSKNNLLFLWVEGPT